MVDKAQEHNNIESPVNLRTQVVYTCSHVFTVIDFEQISNCTISGLVWIIWPQGCDESRPTTNTFEAKETIPRRDIKHSKIIETVGRLETLHMLDNVL